MITQAPAYAAQQFSTVIEATQAYVATARVVARNGITWPDFGELLIGLLRITVRAADTLSTPGVDKKLAVIDSAAALFDGVASLAVPFWSRPFWAVLRPIIRQLVLAIASGAVEQLLPMVRAEE
jgi:hypothetical protein